MSSSSGKSSKVNLDSRAVYPGRAPIVVSVGVFLVAIEVEEIAARDNPDKMAFFSTRT
jgi:hypothetical protein